MTDYLHIIATVIFGLAVVHTFLTSTFQRIASSYPDGSAMENLFHLLGEVEVVFGVWAGVYVAILWVAHGFEHAIEYVDHLNYTEPLFVFAIMTVAATKPIVNTAKSIMMTVSRLLPIPNVISLYIVALIVGPLLGSFITEPAAMTVTALIMRDQYFGSTVSNRFKYVTLATLFVNISIGGVLTPYAAPPVLMVAAKWNWGVSFMLNQFGWKAAIAVVINTTMATLMLRKELIGITSFKTELHPASRATPAWLNMIHIAFLAMIVMSAHHPAFFMGLFMFFLGVTAITNEHQDPLKIRQSLLVAYFLAGLIVLGGPQTWWLQPLLSKLDSEMLFLGATSLTAITDNAALTFLGSQVESMTDVSKYALVAGAVAGGGLTVIANAPNPAGYSILQEKFGSSGISPFSLVFYAFIPTVIAMACFWFL